jgi:hypothetical protein
MELNIPCRVLEVIADTGAPDTSGYSEATGWAAGYWIVMFPGTDGRGEFGT